MTKGSFTLTLTVQYTNTMYNEHTSSLTSPRGLASCIADAAHALRGGPLVGLVVAALPAQGILEHTLPRRWHAHLPSEHCPSGSTLVRLAMRTSPVPPPSHLRPLFPPIPRHPRCHLPRTLPGLPHGRLGRPPRHPRRLPSTHHPALYPAPCPGCPRAHLGRRVLPCPLPIRRRRACRRHRVHHLRPPVLTP